MKSYTLESIFSFGKNNGKSLIEILHCDQSYIDWCLSTLDHFTISDETILEMKKIKNDFIVSENANKYRVRKLEIWKAQEKNKNDQSEKKKNPSQRVRNIKIYELETKLTFGIYSEKTLKEILDIEANYLNWCLINLRHFYLTDQTIDEIKKLKPDFVLTKEANESRLKKFKDWSQRKESERDNFNENQNLTHRDYGYESREDMEIDILFEGDPSLYWNID